MATKITNDKIQEINIAYLELKTYAAVGRKVGVSGSTVKKYIIPNFVPEDMIVRSELTVEELDSIKTYVMPREVFEKESLLMLLAEEVDGIQNLWKELVM